jgi:thiol-disulfide isomerase/thioredoxin
LLVQEVVHELGPRVEMRIEEFGASPLATRFGIEEYPAVFVDDALVARPQDFHDWGGRGGKYLPWSKLDRRMAFQDDVRRMIRARLAGDAIASAPVTATPAAAFRLPPGKIETLDGNAFAFAALADRPTVIELWASWCPPCLQTLRWLATLDPQAAHVVALAVDSPEKDVRKLAGELHVERVAIASASTLEHLGGVSAIPTLLVVDRQGRLVRAFYGAPPDLHDQVRAELDKLR